MMNDMGIKILLLLNNLMFLYKIYAINYIVKFWLGFIGCISIALIFLDKLMDEIKKNMSTELNINSSTELNNTQSNLTFSTETLFTKGQEIISLLITDYFFLFWFSFGIILGTISFISLISVASLVKSILLIRNYFKTNKKIDQIKLLDIIDKIYQGNNKLNFIDSEKSTKIYLLHLYNLKIIQ